MHPRKRTAIASNSAARPGWTVVALAAAASLGVAACGYHSWELTRDPRLTGSAAGYVGVGKPDRQVRPIEVAIFHVEEPTTLAMGARSYVVWLCRGKGQQPQNLGALALRLSGDGHSSNGFLRANTRYNEFRIFVTPEESGQTQVPQNSRVFWTSIEAR